MRLANSGIIYQLKQHKWSTIYFLLCAAVIVVCFGGLVVSKLEYVYIDIGADTYGSYWPYYVFFKNALASDFSFWSFSLGLGGSVFSFIALLFDPFNLILFLFPDHCFPTGLMVTAIFKYLILTILAWIYFRELGFKGVSRLAGALCYVFCGYFTGWGQHYHFATMFVLFTFVLYCFEKYFRRWKYSKASAIPLLVSIALLAFHSVYFSYMSLIFLAIYSVIRYFTQYKFDKKFLGYLIFLFGIVTGAMALSAWSVLPQIDSMTGGARVGFNTPLQLRLISGQEFLTTIARSISNNLLGINEFYGVLNYYEAPFLFTGALTVAILPVLLYKSTKNRIITVSGIFVAVALVFPALTNPVFNAFSANSYRWTFVLTPVLCIGTAYAIDLVLGNKGFRIYAIAGSVCGLIIILIVMYVKRSVLAFTTAALLACLAFSAYFVLFLFYKRIDVKFFKILLTLVIFLDVLSNAYITINQRSAMPTDGSFSISHFDSTGDALELLPNNGFYRIAKNYGAIDLTDPLIRDYYGEKMYSSVISGKMWSFMEAYQIRWPYSNYLFGFEQNEALRGWFSGKYLLTHGENRRYGYECFGENKETTIYKNRYYTPLGVLFNQVLPMEEFNNLNSLERTAAIFKAVTLEDAGGMAVLSAQEASLNLKVNEWNTVFITGSEISTVNPLAAEALNGLSTFDAPEPRVIAIPEASNTKPIVISFETQKNAIGTGNIYYRTENMNYSPNECVTFYISGQKSYYVIPISVLDVVELCIDIPADIKVSKLSLYEWDMDEIYEDMDRLRETAMEMTSFKQDHITGHVNAISDSILCFSIPYNDAWKVFVDGENVETIVTNLAFLGAKIPAGWHEITVTYEQPGLFAGGFISLCSLGLLAILLCINIRHRPVRK